jgi:hypothetical protein
MNYFCIVSLHSPSVMGIEKIINRCKLCLEFWVVLKQHFLVRQYLKMTSIQIFHRFLDRN